MVKNILLYTFLFLSIGCDGSNNPKTLSNEYIATLTQKVGKVFEEGYVFPDKGKEVKIYLKTQLESGEYSGISDYEELAQKIKEDIFTVCNDKHVQINYLADDYGANYRQGKRGADFMDSFENYGFTKVDNLEGQIGYIKLDIFYPVNRNSSAKKAASDAMKSMEGSKAIIFDLRECRGGSPEMLTYIISHLYPPNSNIHLNTFYYRPNNYSFDTYTNDIISGPRFEDTPVYILTSSKTFSCGEEFSYDLKHLKRATLIGETTGGGAHPVEPRKIDDNFEINLPTGRAINPITGTNWEGVGVSPHIKINKDLALEKAIEIIKN